MQPSKRQFRESHRVCTLSALILIALAAIQALGQANETIGLYGAMREGKVVTTFTATGASSGDSIDLTISKTSTAGLGTLSVTIPPGVRLHNTNASWQSMVVSEVRGRLLGGNSYMPEPVITLSDPAPSSQFNVEFPDSASACVLSNASARGLSVAATQAAEWINTDRVTFNDLQAKFPVSFPDWNAARQVVSQCQQPIALRSEVQPMATNVQSNAAVPNVPPTSSLSIEGPQAWSQEFRVGTGNFKYVGNLYVSPNLMRFEAAPGKNGQPVDRHTSGFSVSCEQMSSWTAVDTWANYLSLCPGCGPWNFHIRLKNGKDHEFNLGNKAEMRTALSTISKACGLNQ